MLRETVVYNGRRYYRFPDHSGSSKRHYFWCAYKRVGYLHRHKWEDAFGYIPNGYQIHHKDGNPLNNELFNLECLSRDDHSKQHRLEGLFKRRVYPVKKCLTCDKDYRSTGGRAKFCSKQCKPPRKR